MTEHPAESSAGKTPASKLLPWIVLILASLGLFYLVEKGCGATAQAPEENTETGMSE